MKLFRFSLGAVVLAGGMASEPAMAEVALSGISKSFGDGQQGKVTRVEHLGDQTRLHLELSGHKLVTLTDAHTRINAGDLVVIQPKNPVFFDREVMQMTVGEN